MTSHKFTIMLQAMRMRSSRNHPVLSVNRMMKKQKPPIYKDPVIM
jgi:hypothetical protein